jgi:hypothetical protein
VRGHLRVAYPIGRSGNYVIPDSVLYIANNVFQNASLTNITIPDSVISIDYAAFYGCTSLANITIPQSVTYIDDNVFYNCHNLIIYGYSGSIAEIYANENDIPFIPLDKEQAIYGDIDRGGDVDMTDIVIVGKVVHSRGSVTSDLLAAADLNADSTVNAIDLAIIKYLLLKK